MPAAVEVYRDMAAFASRRQPAWHQLGTVFQEDVSTDEMLRISHLAGWDVRLIETELAGRSDKAYFQTVRTNPFDGLPDVLGMVGERYRVFQNEELLAFGDNILDAGAMWETAGSIKGGRVVFASLAIDRETVLDASGVGDVTKHYLVVFTSHDGTTAINAMVTPVRVVCQNTLNMAVAGAKQSFKIRHTQTAEGKVAAAREALGLTHKYIDAWDKAAQELFAIPVSRNGADAIFNAVYPMPTEDKKGAQTKWENQRDVLWDIYDGETQEGIRDTAWGVGNALTERIDWFRSPRKGSADGVFAAASGFDPVTNATKNAILKTVKAVALDHAKLLV